MTIFLSGSITDNPNYKDQFNSVAQSLKDKYNLNVLNPACFPSGLKNKEYMILSFQMINSADAVVMLNGWEKSKGAVVELQYASYLGLPIFHQDETRFYMDETLDEFVMKNPNETCSIAIFNQEEIHENCTVEVWKNNITGECSVGWRKMPCDWTYLVDKNDFVPSEFVMACCSKNNEMLYGWLYWSEEDNCFICENYGVQLLDVDYWKLINPPKQ